MFGFLKEKLKAAVKKFTKDVEEEVEEIVVEEKEKAQKPKAESKKKEVKEKKEEKKSKPVRKEPKKKEKSVSKKVKEKVEIKGAETQSKQAHSATEESLQPKKGFFEKVKDAFAGPKEEAAQDKPEAIEEKAEDLKEADKEDTETKKEEVEKEKKGFFEKFTDIVTKRTLSEEKFDELFFELEVALLENNVAVEVIEKIKSDMKGTLLSQKVSRIKTEVIVEETLHNSLKELFDIKGINIVSEARKKKPYIICFIGVNGSGKTTNLAKVAKMLQDKGLSPVIAACDTFRAAAIQQLEDHANRLGIKIIKHDYGADAAAVAFDAIEHAKAKGKEVVLIDTAGRSHANLNLMDELEKVVRISKPDLKIFVGDSLTGNDVVEQAKTFNEKVGVDAIILTKLDVDEKGGAAISISYVTHKPIIYLGTGQEYSDLQEFSKEKILAGLGV